MKERPILIELTASSGVRKLGEFIRLGWPEEQIDVHSTESVLAVTRRLLLRLKTSAEPAA